MDTTLTRELDFRIEQRAGVDVLVYADDSCRPASAEESKLWRVALATAVQPQPVAWANEAFSGFVSAKAMEHNSFYLSKYTVPLYAAPQASTAVAEGAVAQLREALSALYEAVSHPNSRIGDEQYSAVTNAAAVLQQSERA